MIDIGKSLVLEQQDNLRHYYRFQSKIYDLTRWAFLFGRDALIKALPEPNNTPDQEHILEVGCGTGYNLVKMHRQRPTDLLTGLDMSRDMIDKARVKTIPYPGVRVLELPYGPGGKSFDGHLDGIVLSYALTMMNPGWEAVIRQAKSDLAVGGWIAVVDFHDARLPFFKKHMAKHHVRMDGHLIPELHEHFEPEVSAVRTAYAGLWQYFLFVGRKK